MAAVNLIYGLGMLDSSVTFDYRQLVMDNVFAAIIKHVVNGISVNEETLGIDVIGKVGPFKQFIPKKHTFNHMRGISQPALIERRVRDKWVKGGSQAMHEKAMDKACDILKNYKPTPLSDEVRSEMRAIIENCEDEIQ